MAARTKAPHEEVARLRADGLLVEDIALHFGVDRRTIIRALRKAGVPPTRGPLSPERLKRLEAMLDEGLSFSEIHRTEGADMETLRRYFPGRQWTPEQVAEFAATRRLWDAVEAAPYAAPVIDITRAASFNRRSSGERRAA